MDGGKTRVDLTELQLNQNKEQIRFVHYGITDAAYEAIPVQLLPQLRPDSIGTLTPTNGGWNLFFFRR